MSFEARPTPWPENGLEWIEQCPLCGGSERCLLYENLTDRVFRTAAGSWNLWSCGGCGAAYLNPRPNEATIGLAYSQYYTHGSPENFEARTLGSRLRRMVGNAYRNERFGTDSHPALLLGHVALRFMPEKRRLIETQWRFLPAPAPATSTRRLLDVGCGNGSFLEFAKSAGWVVAGVEPDPAARAIASAIGADVRPSLDDWTSSGECFDYITTSHVIEHVHDPLSFLKKIFALLRGDRPFFVETPNIRSVGHLVFNRDWRDLDPPRHLVLFNKSNLEATMRAAGLVDIKFHPRSEVFAENAVQSARIQKGLDPFCDAPVEAPLAPADLTDAELMIDRAEFLTVTARKP